MRFNGSVIIVLPLFLFGCATTRTMELVEGSSSGDPSGAPGVDVRSSGTAETGRLAASSFDASALEAGVLDSPTVALDPTRAKPARAPEADASHTSRFTIKGGYYGSTEDALDDGYIIDLSWMRFFSRFFALELEAGYVDTDGSDSGVDTDAWSIPLMVNGRFNVPVWVLDVYAGAGIGTFYYDADASGALSESDTGFLAAGDAFLGATINLSGGVSLGLEGKYYLTDEISDLNTGLDSYAIMLTLGFAR